MLHGLQLLTIFDFSTSLILSPWSNDVRLKLIFCPNEHIPNQINAENNRLCGIGTHPKSYVKAISSSVNHVTKLALKSYMCKYMNHFACNTPSIRMALVWIKLFKRRVLIRFDNKNK